VETFIVFIDLKTGNLHAEVEGTDCCPGRADPPMTLDNYVQEYRAGLVATVMVNAAGKISLGSSSLRPYLFGMCCGERSREYYQALFNQYLEISASNPAPGAEEGEGLPAKTDSEALAKQIKDKQKQKEIETLEAEIKFLEKAAIPDRDEIEDKVKNELSARKVDRNSMIEIWDRDCDDKLAADPELQAIITTSELEKRVLAPWPDGMQWTFTNLATDAEPEWSSNPCRDRLGIRR